MTRRLKFVIEYPPLVSYYGMPRVDVFNTERGQLGKPKRSTASAFAALARRGAFGGRFLLGRFLGRPSHAARLGDLHFPVVPGPRHPRGLADNIAAVLDFAGRKRGDVGADRQ